MPNAFENMDRMYRYQRYFYDLTRKYYLLGRDQLLREMTINGGDNILEIGCGTARNLAILSRNFPNANFFGLDASTEMLKTACENTAPINNITLQTALADDFSFGNTFNLAAPFDTVFFSYSISMIPTWKASITNALKNLKPDGKLFIVDFYDQRDLPVFFQKLLQIWLKQFHVQFWSDLIPFLESLTVSFGTLRITPLYRRYSFIAEFQKR